MNAQDKKEIDEMLGRHIGVLAEAFQHKLDIVVEGHEVLRREIREVRDESNARHDHTAFLIGTLNSKIDAVDASLTRRIDEVETKLSTRIDSVELNLSAKIDAVACDLAAHRKDTEAHGGVWRVKEEG